MIGPALLFYSCAGIITTLAAMLAFPPEPGYRPKLTLQFVAAATFIVFWPVIVGLAIWYGYRVMMDEAFRTDRVAKETDFPVPRTVPIVKPK